MYFKSHIDGKNANVGIFVDRVEWERPRGVSAAKLTAGAITGGLSLLGTGLYSNRAGSEVIPLKAITSVTTRRDGLLYTKVQVTCSGNTIDFRVPHGEAPVVKRVLTDLILGKHPAQLRTDRASSPTSSFHMRSVPNLPTPSIADELNKLAQLRTAGLLTNEEFDNEKRKLLNS